MYLADEGFTKGIIEPVETGWPAKAPYKPRWVSNHFMLDKDLFRYLGTNAEQRQTLPRTGRSGERPGEREVHAAIQRDLFVEGLSRSPAMIYDAFYVLAYAAWRRTRRRSKSVEDLRRE